jgi:uncharacterized protein
LDDDDLGALWEHFVLNEIMTRSQSPEVFYWRDKRGYEVDFVIATHRRGPAAIECKWSANNFDPTKSYTGTLESSSAQAEVARQRRNRRRAYRFAVQFRYNPEWEVSRG